MVDIKFLGSEISLNGIDRKIFRMFNDGSALLGFTLSAATVIAVVAADCVNVLGYPLEGRHEDVYISILATQIPIASGARYIYNADDVVEVGSKILKETNEEVAETSIKLVNNLV